eukprot:CAMPEP_0179276606 /NCGR_PEP_ID=MMETSP0797-20121207/34666_1 /TAXON_ID=47934 /ORGANISM="Dinophysis acuminata, Strain DAEP01" /LENGTH=67 /DNA_ID=CAMNT_0020985171 /DNA_START=146 /DNA_END=349 /DNA_ORIENTATION=+
MAVAGEAAATPVATFVPAARACTQESCGQGTSLRTGAMGLGHRCTGIDASSKTSKSMCAGECACVQK